MMNKVMGLLVELGKQVIQWVIGLLVTFVAVEILGKVFDKVVDRQEIRQEKRNEKAKVKAKKKQEEKEIAWLNAKYEELIEEGYDAEIVGTSGISYPDGNRIVWVLYREEEGN